MNFYTDVSLNSENVFIFHAILLMRKFSYVIDKTLIVWKLTREENNFGVPQKRLYGHSHFVSDVVLSSDGHFALSGSWDKTLRLWDLSAGKSTRRFEDHTKVIASFFFENFFYFWMKRNFDDTIG